MCLALSAKKKTVQKNCFNISLSIFFVNFLRPSDLKLAILCFVFAKLKMTVSAFPQTRFSCHWQRSFSSQLKPALFALVCYLIYLCFVPCSISQKENSSFELLSYFIVNFLCKFFATIRFETSHFRLCLRKA